MKDGVEAMTAAEIRSARRIIPAKSNVCLHVLKTLFCHVLTAKPTHFYFSFKYIPFPKFLFLSCLMINVCSRPLIAWIRLNGVRKLDLYK